MTMITVMMMFFFRDVDHDDLLLIMISMMSIIIGNYEGMGELRKEELFKSALLYNIIRDNIYIIDHIKLQDSMNNIWCSDLIADIIIQHIKIIKPNIVSKLYIYISIKIH